MGGLVSGRVYRRANGRRIGIDTTNASVRTVLPHVSQKILSVAAPPVAVSEPCAHAGSGEVRCSAIGLRRSRRRRARPREWRVGARYASVVACGPPVLSLSLGLVSLPPIDRLLPLHMCVGNGERACPKERVCVSVCHLVQTFC